MARTRRTVVTSLVAVALALGVVPGLQPIRASVDTTTIPGLTAWRAARHTGVRLPDLAAKAPGTVATFFASLPAGEARTLAGRFPAFVGNLDGVPPALRYAANQDTAGLAGLDDLLGLRGRQLLAFDPRERGLAVEVFGDLATARRIAVLVPGAGSDLYHLDGPGGVAADAHALLAEARREDPGTQLAVVAWAGYDTPAEPDAAAMQGSLARAGAGRLERFLAGLTTYTAAPISLFCHSYGSVVCGMTPLPARVTDITVYGSPGVRAKSASDLSPTARVWAALAADDPIRWLPAVRLGDYGHGPSPVDPSFGARVVAATGARGHSGYFDQHSESLRNFVRIALGRRDQVSLASPAQARG